MDKFTYVNNNNQYLARKHHKITVASTHLCYSFQSFLSAADEVNGLPPSVVTPFSVSQCHLPLPLPLATSSGKRNRLSPVQLLSHLKGGEYQPPNVLMKGKKIFVIKLNVNAVETPINTISFDWLCLLNPKRFIWAEEKQPVSVCKTSVSWHFLPRYYFSAYYVTLIKWKKNILNYIQISFLNVKNTAHPSIKDSGK